MKRVNKKYLGLFVVIAIVITVFTGWVLTKTKNNYSANTNAKIRNNVSILTMIKIN